MQLSVSINITDILNSKGDIFERIFARHKLFKKTNKISEILLPLKRSGISGVELVLSTKTKDCDIILIQKIFKKYKLPVLSIHQPLGDVFGINYKEIKKLFEFADTLSARIIVLHLPTIGNSIFDRSFVQDLKNLEKKYKIIIGIENSPKSILFLFNKFYWRDKEFINAVEKSDFKINLDTTHFGRSGINIIDFFQKNKQRIISIHLSDFDYSTKKQHLPLGFGDLPIKKFIQLLKTENFNGPITLEIDSSLEEHLESAKFLKNLLNRINNRG